MFPPDRVPILGRQSPGPKGNLRGNPVSSPAGPSCTVEAQTSLHSVFLTAGSLLLFKINFHFSHVGFSSFSSKPGTPPPKTMMAFLQPALGPEVQGQREQAQTLPGRPAPAPRACWLPQGPASPGPCSRQAPPPRRTPLRPLKHTVRLAF